jgi:hypothetical protein
MRESLVRLRNSVEVLLEQAQIKLSSVISDLFGKSGPPDVGKLAPGHGRSSRVGLFARPSIARQ